MIIVSQDKSVILNFNNIVSLELGEHIKNLDGERETVIQAVVNINDYNILGYYETEERAKEVLQEIIEKYEIEQRMKYNIEFIRCTNLDKDYRFVYEMPKD